MVRQCSIKRCKSESFAGCGVSFHRLPLKEIMKQKWLDAISKCLRNVRMPVVCSMHFRPEDYYQGRYRFKLREDAVPSIFPVSANTEHETPLLVKMEEEEEGTQLANLSVTVTSVASPKYLIQMVDGSPTVLGPMLVELKTESDTMKTDENLPSVGDEVLSFDEVGPLEDLVPLSAHPVPLSTAPDPLCDVKVKVEAINEPAEDAMGAEEDRRVGVSCGGVGGGTPLRAVAPPTADLLETCKIEQKIKNLTRHNERDRARLRNVVKAIRRRDMMISGLRERLGALGTGAGVLSAGAGAPGAGAGALGDGASALGAGADQHSTEHERALMGIGAKGDEMSETYSIKKDERMKKANRQLLVIERDDRHKLPDFRQNSSNNRQKSSDIRQKSIQITSDNRKKSSVQGHAEILVTSIDNFGNTSDIRQKTLVGAKPILVIEEKYPVSVEHTPRESIKNIPKNTLVVVQPTPDNAENSSVGTRTTLEVRPKSSLVKPESVVQQIGSKRKSEIRLEQSSDIPQTSVGVQRTSDIRQNTLVIQIDGMQSTVIPPKLVRLKDNDMDIG